MVIGQPTRLNPTSSNPNQQKNWYEQLLALEPASSSHLEKLISIDKRVVRATLRALHISPGEDLSKIMHLLELITCEYQKADLTGTLIIRLQNKVCSLDNNALKDIPLSVAMSFVHLIPYTLFTQPTHLYSIAIKYFEETRPALHSIITEFYKLEKENTLDIEQSPF